MHGLISHSVDVPSVCGAHVCRCVFSTCWQGIVQLNPDVNAFQRKLVNEVRRCDEMERKLRYLEREIRKDGIPVLDTGENPEAPMPREMIDLEETYERLENELKEVNSNAEALKRNYLELTELKHILKKTQVFFDEKMEENPPKVNKWDGNAIKNALDDAVKDVLLTRFYYVESHKLLDGRLLISTIAVCFTLLALLWDWLFPFPNSREVMCVCVICYFIMMGVLTWYTTYMERGIFCTALNKDAAGIDPDDIWHASSSLKRFDHIYHLTLSQKDGKNSQMKEACTQFTIEHFFEESGKLVYPSVEREVLRLHSDVDHKKE